MTADGGNCTAVTSVTVPENTNAPTAVVNPNVPSIGCNNLTISLDGIGSSTGDFTYLWTTSNGFIISGETTLNPLVNMAGNYQLLVTDNSNGCTAIESVSVTGNTTPPTVSYTHLTLPTICSV